MFEETPRRTNHPKSRPSFRSRPIERPLFLRSLPNAAPKPTSLLRHQPRTQDLFAKAGRAIVATFTLAKCVAQFPEEFLASASWHFSARRKNRGKCRAKRDNSAVAAAIAADYSTNMIRAYEEIADLIAAGGGPEAVIGFQASAVTQERVADLIARDKSCLLSEAERSELDQYIQLEHVMRLAKARAQARLSHE